VGFKSVWRKPAPDEEIVVTGECDCGAMAERCICNTEIVKRGEKDE
jgi:hypothetical protein